MAEKIKQNEKKRKKKEINGRFTHKLSRQGFFLQWQS